MQLGVKKARVGQSARTLADLRTGEAGTLVALNLDEDMAGRLMELGFFPGVTVVPGCCAPGGDPRVFRVDGSEIALRRETYELLTIR